MKEENGHTVVENRGNDNLVNLGFARLSQIKTFTEQEVDIHGLKSKKEPQNQKQNGPWAPLTWLAATQLSIQ